MKLTMKNNNVFFVVVGPSGSGKDSVAGKVFKEKGIPETISLTTRKMREGEVNGVDYHFVDSINEDEMAEYATYGGNVYGLSKKEIEDKMNDYEAFFAIVEIDGLRQLKELYANVIPIYMEIPGDTLDDKVETMKNRMRNRKDDEEKIEQRINLFLEKEEYEHYKYCKYRVDNRYESVARREIEKIIAMETTFKAS